MLLDKKGVDLQAIRKFQRLCTVEIMDQDYTRVSLRYFPNIPTVTGRNAPCIMQVCNLLQCSVNNESLQPFTMLLHYQHFLVCLTEAEFLERKLVLQKALSKTCERPNFIASSNQNPIKYPNQQQ